MTNKVPAFQNPIVCLLPEGWRIVIEILRLVFYVSLLGMASMRIAIAELPPVVAPPENPITEEKRVLD